MVQSITHTRGKAFAQQRTERYAPVERRHQSCSFFFFLSFYPLKYLVNYSFMNEQRYDERGRKKKEKALRAMKLMIDASAEQSESCQKRVHPFSTRPPTYRFPDGWAWAIASLHSSATAIRVVRWRYRAAASRVPQPRPNGHCVSQVLKVSPQQQQKK